ncbi:MAG TPA: SDR family oxidoreductase [Chitinophagaceae bacterium]|nr:SDR family oxidoreductase [Chitinophagaceae bacterium]
MKILITGNLGYVGPGVIREFRKHYPDACLIGYDIGYFSQYITNRNIIPDAGLTIQHYGDVRNFPDEILEGVDTVIGLAAISNDPIGNRYESQTHDINCKAIIDLALKAKNKGAKKFVFASSCSVYGSAEDKPRTEDSALNPLTAYAKSKINAESGLEPLADNNFQVTCLRFATACGMSDRLRLDLVLNDFVAGAITNKEINILSDGTPWRPLIHVLDMARAMRWAHERNGSTGGDFVVVNAGSNAWNYQVKELANMVQQIMPEVKVSINKDAEPDKRSYRVNFDLFEKLAPDHQPQYDLKATVYGLINGLKAIEFQDSNYRNSNLMRLNVIQNLVKAGTIDQSLFLNQPQ